MTDKEIRDFFHQNRPSLIDDTTFLAGLSSKMEAMSEVKKMHDELVLRNRIILAVTFCIGVLVGGGIFAFVILKPVTAPQFKIGLMSSLLSFLAEWKHALFLLITALSIGLSLISIKKSYL